VADDFRKFFSLRDEMKMHVFHFVSVIDDLNGLDYISVREKYKLPDKYFLVSNQFHRHKNHIVLFKTLVRLKEKRPDIHIAITGRFPDSSHSAYLKKLHSIIDQNNLHSQISLLGVIPRNEQLLLMKHSQAILQPSLFEGWSTVIEDAISLQVPVIASSLVVNREQLGPDGNFFQPHNDQDLADILADCPERKLDDIIYEDYNTRVIRAAKSFIGIFLKNE
jgi:glycosyltransferase involved in cell wall biosynthesis